MPSVTMLSQVVTPTRFSSRSSWSCSADKEVENTYNSETDLGFGSSLAIPYTVKGHASTFELGGLFRNEHKFINQNTQWFAPLVSLANPSDPTSPCRLFLTTFLTRTITAARTVRTALPRT